MILCESWVNSQKVQVVFLLQSYCLKEESNERNTEAIGIRKDGTQIPVIISKSTAVLESTRFSQVIYLLRKMAMSAL